MVYELSFPVFHSPRLFGAPLMVVAQDVDESMNDERAKPRVKGDRGPIRLYLRLLDGNDDVADQFVGEAVEIGKGDDIGGLVPSETFLVESRNPFIIGEQDAEVPTLQP